MTPDSEIVDLIRDQFGEQAIEDLAPDEWDVEKAPGALHDVVVTRPGTPREILVNTRQSRVSYRNAETGEWGIQQRPVTDVVTAVTQLRTNGSMLDLSEMHMLGIDGHPDRPEM